MTVEMLKGKIHRATVVQAELDYVGSITVDEDLLEAAGIMEYEKVQIVDVNNGSRNLPAADADIRPKRRAAASVDDRAAANDPIQHEKRLLFAPIIAHFCGKSTRTVDFCRDVGYNKENPSSEVTPMAVKIEKDTIIGDVLDLAPETAPLFQAIGMHCLGCPASRGESVEEACMVHGVDPDAFLAQVNHFIEAVEANK